MIQRIQTVYLALAALLSALLMKGSIAKMVGSGGEDYMLTWKGIFLNVDGISEVVEKSYPLTLVIILTVILFTISIFLFRNRKLQIRVTVLTTLLNIGSLLLILFYTFFVGNRLGAEYIFGIKMVFPLAGSIFGYLAFRGILKDELLVKSYDRIR